MSQRERLRSRATGVAIGQSLTARGMPPMASNVELHIETLSLSGLGSRYGIALGNAIQGELTQMIKSQGLSAAGSVSRAIDRLRAPDVRLASTEPGVAGEIAHAVYASLGNREGRPVG